MKSPESDGGGPTTARPATVADRLAGLAGWRVIAAAIGAGLLAALAQAPLRLLPLLAVGFSLSLLLLDAVDRRTIPAPRPHRAAFAIGWGFGFGYHLLGLYWLGFSFLVQAEQFAWMAPIAVLSMPAFLAFFWGAAFATARTLWRRARLSDSPRRGLLFAGVFMIAEYARGHVLTGLPWNLPGQTFAAPLPLIQSAAWYGVYGLSLVVVLLALAPAAFAGPQAERRGLIRGAVGATLGVLALFAVGTVRLALHPAAARDDVAVRIVQPNIPQREKINPDLWARNIERAAALSAPPAIDDRQLYILWPENAAPVIDEAPWMIERVDALLPERAILLAGAVRRETEDEGGAVYNSLAFLIPSANGRMIGGYYDKHHLAPFGEYLPLAGLLRTIGLAQLAPYEEGFAKGPGPRRIEMGPARFAPLICYETIFPGAIYPRGERPDWLVVVTNDAWFGDSAGPRQHLDQGRLRAVELGLPMARAANTGVSALIDPVGRYVGRLALYESGAIDAPLPEALAPTLYARLGDGPFFVMLASVLAGAALRKGHRKPA